MIQLLEDGNLPVDPVQRQHAFGVCILLQVGRGQTAWKGTDRSAPHGKKWEEPPNIKYSRRNPHCLISFFFDTTFIA